MLDKTSSVRHLHLCRHIMSDSQAESSYSREDLGQAANRPSLRKACEPCRFRKIRCDRSCPCSQCLQLNISCSKAERRPRMKHPSVATVSGRYEEKIDLIDRRLDDITQLFNDIRANIPFSNDQAVASQSDTTSAAASAAQSQSSKRRDNPAYPSLNSPAAERDPSLAAHCAFVKEFIHNKVSEESLDTSSRDVQKALNSLCHVINALDQRGSETETSYPHARPVTRPLPTGSDLPPIEVVVDLIRTSKSQIASNPLNTATWICDFVPIESFSHMCLRLYFPENVTESDHIIVNFGLHQLFVLQLQMQSDDESQSRNYARKCCANLESALARLPLHLPMTAKTTVALLLGAIHAIEFGKPLLAWSLASKASTMCQTLGYHRLRPSENTITTDETRARQLLFWVIYFIEKSLSLRLGRASTIQDWDITTPVLSLHHNPSPLETTVSLWIHTARCQGNIYKGLYSPDAMAQPLHIRQFRIDALSSELHQLELKSQEIRAHHLQAARKKFDDSMIEYITRADEVLRSSLLTLVHRASPPCKKSQSELTQECVDAARNTLQRHQDFLVAFEGVNPLYLSTYVHWTLNFAPFTPFIVLVCHSIETRNKKDLKQLQDFIDRMESNPALLEAAEKMHHLFKVLYEVALRYLEYYSSAVDSGQSQDNSAIRYLTSLGHPFPGQIGTRQENLWLPRDTGFVEHSHQSVTTQGLECLHPAFLTGSAHDFEQWLAENQHIIDQLEGVYVCVSDGQQLNARNTPA